MTEREWRAALGSHYSGELQMSEPTRNPTSEVRMVKDFANILGVVATTTWAYWLGGVTPTWQLGKPLEH